MSVIGEAHFGQKNMSGAVSDVPRASTMLTLLEDTEARRKRVTVGEARTAIARTLRVPAKTLLNIRKQRRKAVQNSLLTGIRDRLIAVLQLEVQECEHLIALYRQTGVDCREDDFLAVATSIAAAKKILDRAIRPG
jgi:hypothetical protein